MINVKKKSVIGMFMLGCSIFPSQLSASNPLEAVFGMMVTSAGPKAFESQSRNGMAFGTYSARFQLSTPKVVNFNAPTISAGCGGIDFFGGSISLIKKEELVQMGRSIAAGAAVYAFNLAVESICPSCAQGMAWLQDKMDKMNEFTKTSCQGTVDALARNQVGVGAAQSLRKNLDVKGWENKFSSFADTLPETNGYGNWTDFLEERSSTGNAEDVKLPGLIGNIVWEALGEADIDDWSFIGGVDSDVMQTILLSLVGTKIMAPNGAELQVGHKEPTLTIDDLLYNETDADLTVLKCSGTPPPSGRTKCFSMAEETIRWQGVKGKAYDLLIGDGSTAGIAQQIVIKGNLTTPQKQLINSVNVPAMSMLFYLGKDTEAQKVIAEQIATTVGLSVVNKLIDELHKQLRIAKGATDSNPDASQNAISYLEGRITFLISEKMKVQKEYADSMEQSEKIMDKYESLLSYVKNMGSGGAY